MLPPMCPSPTKPSFLALVSVVATSHLPSRLDADTGTRARLSSVAVQVAPSVLVSLRRVNARVAPNRARLSQRAYTTLDHRCGAASIRDRQSRAWRVPRRRRATRGGRADDDNSQKHGCEG